MPTMTITPASIKQDENFLCGIETEHTTPVLLYVVYIGSDRLQYYLFFGKDNLLFEGKDFGPSPLYGYDSLENIVHCLQWLTLKPGDVDKEYFKDYTPAQLEFCNTEIVNNISGYLDDYRNTETDAESKEYKANATHVLQAWFFQ